MSAPLPAWWNARSARSMCPQANTADCAASRWPSTKVATARTGCAHVAFSAAPGQRLLSPALTSSLFPHLPPRSRKVFLMGLVLLAGALTVATFLRMPAALIAIASLGLPLLFALYLRESGVSRDIPRSTLALTVALGVILGVGWVLLTGAAVARAYGVPLGAGIAGGRILRDGIGVPVGSMLLMLVPALVARFAWRGNREALDGYAIGALGALTFTAAATLTRLAPQFTTGMINRVRPLDGLLVEAGIRGIAMPLTAAAVGGLIGTALWFTRPPTKVDKNRGFVGGTLIADRAGGDRRLRRAGPGRRRPLSAMVAIGTAPDADRPRAVRAADRPAPGAVARGAGRDPHRRTDPVHGVQSRCARCAVLRTVRGRHARIVATITQDAARRTSDPARRGARRRRDRRRIAARLLAAIRHVRGRPNRRRRRSGKWRWCWGSRSSCWPAAWSACPR